MKSSIKYVLFVLVAILVLGAAVWSMGTEKTEQPITIPPPVTVKITTFEQCVAAGNPVTESHPRECRTATKTFTESNPVATSTADLIHVTSPLPNASISSPLVITGEARGSWFFEASFPIFLTDWDGKIIAQGVGKANGNWMTTNFVPFTATLTFPTQKKIASNRGTLILKKDNPSGMPENDKAIEIPITFKEIPGVY